MHVPTAYMLPAPAFIIAAAFVLAIGLFFFEPLTDLYEDIAYMINPTAQRAFDYGERHFDASDPSMYDVNRAEHFFELAAAKDPSVPYLYHELARIAFLHGDLEKALVLINVQIAKHGDSEANSYYVRGLIEGYQENYAAAATDYAHYLQFDPNNWAALNDYAWVLLQAGRPEEALAATEHGLSLLPDNPWLLNTESIALYGMGSTTAAYAAAQHAATAAQGVTDSEWLTAYPGNDPRIANEGVTTLQRSAEDNMHRIGDTVASSTIQ